MDKEHLTLQSSTFLNFFSFLWVTLPTWIRIHANPHPKQWYFELRQCQGDVPTL
jgi:hypothetical protein